MIIIKTVVREKDVKNLEDILSKKLEDKVVLLPNEFNIQSFHQYEVWPKFKYIEFMVKDNSLDYIKSIIKNWNDISKGFEFIIAIRNNNTDYNNYDFYSVPCFNKMMSEINNAK